MFSVIFEVQPKDDQWHAYLGYARLLRPDLVQVDGFIENLRYRSRRRIGRVLSHSTWRDEKALIRWRTLAAHHDVQVQGRHLVFGDYHLRVGQVTADSHWPEGHDRPPQRWDATETGASKHVTITEMQRPADLPLAAGAVATAERLGLRTDAEGLVDWDVFEGVLEPADLLLLASWRDAAAAPPDMPEGVRRRDVLVIRDYGMFDRREAPQYYPEVVRTSTAPG